MNNEENINEQAPTKKPRKKEIKGGATDAFFQKIASRANYLNKDIVEEVYREMLRVVVHELSTKGQVELPGLACMTISYRKPFIVKTPFYKNGVKGYEVPVAGHTMVNFRADYKIKAYFKEKPVPEWVFKKPQADGRLWYI